MEYTVFTPHAYVPSQLAVKSSHPQDKYRNRTAKIQFISDIAMVFQKKTLILHNIWHNKMFLYNINAHEHEKNIYYYMLSGHGNSYDLGSDRYDR